MAQRRLDDGMFWEQNEDSLELIADMISNILCDWYDSPGDEVSGSSVATINSALRELLTRRTIAKRAFEEANTHDSMKELVYVHPTHCPKHRRTVLVTLTEEKEEAKK